MPGYGGKSYRGRAPVRRAVKPVTKRTVRKAVTTVKAKRFRAAVKSVVLQQQETKHISDAIAQEAAVNGGGLSNDAGVNMKGWFFPNVVERLVPQQGNFVNERDGDRIAPTSIYLKGMVSTNGFDAVSNLCFRPFAVRILVLRHVADDEPPATLNIKKNDSSNVPSVVPIDGSVLNEMYPYGSVFKIIAARTYKLRAPDSG